LKTGITLTNVAKSSQEELLEDYEDFLRQNGFEVWNKNDPRVKAIRAKASELIRNLSNLSSLGNLRESGGLIQKNLPFPQDPEKAANLLHTLCHIATYLLNRQVEGLERKHQREGGYSEKLYQKRVEYRKIPK
jgi:restriction system protein